MLESTNFETYLATYTQTIVYMRIEEPVSVGLHGYGTFGAHSKTCATTAALRFGPVQHRDASDT